MKEKEREGGKKGNHGGRREGKRGRVGRRREVGTILSVVLSVKCMDFALFHTLQVLLL